MNKLRKFENYAALTSSDFDDRLAALGEFTDRKAEIYSEPIDQIKIDLYYGIKYKIKEYLDYAENGWTEKTQQKYEKILNNEIDKILYKFSEEKYQIIKDKQKIKDLLWKLINEKIPYDEVDYYHKYKLDDKLIKILSKVIKEI